MNLVLEILICIHVNIFVGVNLCFGWICEVELKRRCEPTHKLRGHDVSRESTLHLPLHESRQVFESEFDMG